MAFWFFDYYTQHYYRVQPAVAATIVNNDFNFTKTLSPNESAIYIKRTLEACSQSKVKKRKKKRKLWNFCPSLSSQIREFFSWEWKEKNFLLLDVGNFKKILAHKFIVIDFLTFHPHAVVSPKPGVGGWGGGVSFTRTRVILDLWAILISSYPWSISAVDTVAVIAGSGSGS